MRHEVLELNSKRAYVLVNDTWYDTSKELHPEVGQRFLVGYIEDVLSFEDYTKRYPESKDEILPHVIDKTISGGYIRRTINGEVKYAVNPATPRVGDSASSREAIND